MYSTVTKENPVTLQKQQYELRAMVFEGLRQVKEGKTKDFNQVFDRLEKKYICDGIHR